MFARLGSHDPFGISHLKQLTAAAHHAPAVGPGPTAPHLLRRLLPPLLVLPRGRPHVRLQRPQLRPQRRLLRLGGGHPGLPRRWGGGAGADSKARSQRESGRGLTHRDTGLGTDAAFGKQEHGQPE